MYPFSEGSYAPRNGWYVAAFTNEIGEALLSRSVRQSLDPAPGGIVELPPLVLRGRSRPVEIYCMPSGRRLDLRPATA